MSVQNRRNDPNKLGGKRVLLLGLGSRQGGVGVARYLVEQGAEVRVTDLRSAEQLADSLDDLRELTLSFTLGKHEESDIDWADVIVRNPAVPAESPWLALARERGKRIEMEMTLFFRACPAPIVGVTGTKGKTTTTTLLSSMLRERWPESVLAGNMGVSALMELPKIGSDVPVALELSSFQLEALDEHRLSPHVAVITNISPDHLDRYPSFADYAYTKSAIVRHQSSSDWFIVNAGDAHALAAIAKAPGEPVVFDTYRSIGATPALWIEDEHFIAGWPGQVYDFGPTDALRVPGDHSRLNALAAAGAALALGVTPDQIRAGIAAFPGVPHRMEHVATIDGVEYINDTAATAPAAAVAALRAYTDRDVVVIAGGYDKQLPLEPLADALTVSAQHVVLLAGTATPLLEQLLCERGFAGIAGTADSMDAAVRMALGVALPGGVVLLSPGTASFGMFRDEFHRGEMFREAVRNLDGSV